MAKKWYEYIVSVEGQSVEAPPVPAESSAADAVAQIAASLKSQPAIKMPATADASLSFPQIYEAAEIQTPTHGYTIQKIADMLQSEHIRNLPAEVKRGSVLVALDAAGVKIDDVIKDAIQRDRALDAFEKVQQQSVEALEAAKTDENRKIQTELDRVIQEQKAKMLKNLEEVNVRKEAFAAWRIKKQQEEQKISDSVSYFVAENPITTGGRTASSLSGNTGKERA